MAIFKPNEHKNVCKLNFDNKFTYELPLHEDFTRKVAQIAEKQQKALQNLLNGNEEEFKTAYNMSLDALDELVGEGAGADIMSIFENPGLYEVASVINYIANEYKEAYSELLNKYKAQGKAPAATLPRGRK